MFVKKCLTEESTYGGAPSRCLVEHLAVPNLEFSI